MSTAGRAAPDHDIPGLLDAVAAAIPDSECIVQGDHRLTWRDFRDRTAALAAALVALGIGGEVDHAVDPWESPHDHVALYLTNGPAYLEAMVGAWKARAVGVNVNYRYTVDELVHLLTDAGAVAVVFHRRFGPTLAEALPTLPAIRLLVSVEDGSDEPLPAGSVDLEDLIRSGELAARPAVTWSPDDRYVVYTGGTTGRPKGVLWRQGDFLATALGFGSTREEVVARALKPGRPRTLPAPPFMHGASQWNVLSCWLSGGTVVIQSDGAHLDPADILDTCVREAVGALLIVGDSFARPLLDEQAARPRDLRALRTVMSGGAVLSPALRGRFAELLPDVRIVDILGSSETGRHGVATSRAGGGLDGFERSASTVVLSEDRTRALEPGDPERGWLAQAGRVPLGYLHDPVKTAETFPVIGGVRHAVAGDRARLRSDGRIELLGRDSVTINTGGEKVHAEEVEQAVKQHPSVYDAIVVGRPSERWGQEVVAVVAVAEGHAFDPHEVTAAAARHVARYKLPKHYVVVPSVVRSPSGKPDYGWARAQAVAAAERGA